MKATGRDFPAAVRAVADRLGVSVDVPALPNVPPPGEPAERPATNFSRSFKFDAEPDEAELAAWCETKPPVAVAAAVAAGAVTGARRTRNADDGRRCVAFPARPAPGADPDGWLLYAADGGPLVVGTGEKPREAKTYNLPGGGDGWVFVGTPDDWGAAEVRVRVEGVGDALALAPHLPDDWTVASNVCGAGSRRCPVGPFAGRPAVVIGDADEPGRKGAAAFARRVAEVSDAVTIADLPSEVGDGGDVRDLLNAAADSPGGPAAAIADLIATAATPGTAPADGGDDPPAP